MQYVILGLGSNRSWSDMTSTELLKKACKKLSHILKNCVLSAVYTTKPMYYENQSHFYNMAVAGYLPDEVSAFDLLQKIHMIEASLGRNREMEIRNGPRSIDIDIEYFDGMSINTPDLQIPHPRMWERGFVLVPLLDVLSDDEKAFDRNRVKKQLKELDVLDIKKYSAPLNIIEESL